LDIFVLFVWRLYFYSFHLLSSLLYNSSFLKFYLFFFLISFMRPVISHFRFTRGLQFPYRIVEWKSESRFFYSYLLILVYNYII
jgi:hypothetical protein